MLCFPTVELNRMSPPEDPGRQCRIASHSTLLAYPMFVPKADAHTSDRLIANPVLRGTSRSATRQANNTFTSSQNVNFSLPFIRKRLKDKRFRPECLKSVSPQEK